MDKRVRIIRFIIGIMLLIISFFIENIFISLLSYILLALPNFINMLENFKKKVIMDENFLMFVATIGALIIGETHEAIMVVLLYQIGEILSDKAITKSKNKIISLMNLKNNKVRLKNGKFIDPSDVKIGDIIVIKAGEKLFLDGTVENGNGQIDTSSITGETVPKVVKKGDNILSGVVSLDTVLEIKVTTEYKNSIISKIMDMMENISDNKTNTEKFITTFAKIYTPIVIALSILITIIPLILGYSLTKWLYRSLTFLVISCPCALVISIPLAYFIGMGVCSNHGILVKNSSILEMMNKIKIIAFDKTGTLTLGNFKVNRIIPLYKTKEELIKYAAYAEYNSSHPIAKAIMNEYKDEIDIKLISNYNEIAGKGIKLKIAEENVLVGNRILLEENNVKYPKIDFIGTVVLVAVNKKYIGTIVIGDELKEDVDTLTDKLKTLGIEKNVMLSGDNCEIVKKVGKLLKMDESYAELLPTDKVELIKELKKHGYVLFMGDGINDALVISLADIGISMGNLGSDVCLEASDVVIMNDNPSKLIDLIKISKLTKKIIKQNIIFAIAFKVIVLFLSFLGITTMWLALLSDVGVTLMTILNSIRICKEK